MKTVATFRTEAEAYIAKGMRADHGIESMTGPDNMTTLYGAGSTWAPVDLYVRDADFEEARRLLEAHSDV